MIGPLNRASAIAMALLVAASLPPAGALQAQDGARFRVLVPDLFPLDDDKGFGQRVADELRDLINELPTHQPIDEDEIDDNLDKFDLDMDELNCIDTRQLGAQMNAQIAICATYTAMGDQREFQTIEVWELTTSESFVIDGFSVHKDEREEAARRIIEEFDLYNQQLRFTQFCAEYTNSENWESALRNCEDGLELNPTSASTLYQTGFILYKMERLEESLARLNEVLAVDPFKENALQLAGYVATQLGREDEGREYYGQYLELNPGDAGVRRNIAYEMYEAGDPEGAMLFIEEGIAVDENPDLYQDLGNYAFAAASNAVSGVGAADGGLEPEVADFYRRAIDAYMKVFAIKGAEMDVGQLRNVVAAHVRLENFDEAIRTAEEILQTHPTETSLLDVYAGALREAGRVDDAVDALGRIEAIDPEYPNLNARQGNMMLQVGRHDDAMPLLQRAVERGDDPNVVARMLLAEAVNGPVQDKSWTTAINLFEKARDFEVSTEQHEELDFWLGYSLLQRATAAQAPQTVQSAQSALPMFQRARSLLAGARAYDQRQGGRMQVGQLVQATDQYIAIQEAVIKRGGGA